MKGCVFMNKLDKAFIDIVNILNRDEVTYNDAQSVLRTVWVHIKQTREMSEYNSASDYFNGNKNCDIGDTIIEKLSF